ncbi:MAG: Rieske (2Fe-2S) protein [Gemmatimonadaceae bacterium]
MTSTPPPADESRRHFIGSCASALGSLRVVSLCAPLALGACASVMTRPVTPENGRVRLDLSLYRELKEPGGSLRILPDGATNPIYVLALDNGTFAALSPICTHLGCTVDIQGPRLVCPCHGSTYDREGTVLQGPAERPLARLATEVSASGVLTILLSADSR